MSAEVERSLLGSFLTSPELFRQLDSISADDFTLSSHRTIYRAMAALDAQSKPIDAVLICNSLNGQLESVGGKAYVMSLIDDCVPERAEHYAEAVHKAAIKRRLLNAIEIAKSQIDDGASPEEVISGISASMPVSVPRRGMIRQLADVPNIQRMDIPPIDYLVPGLISRKTITLWTGADGTAKSFVALNMAIAVASGGQFLGRRCQESKVLYLDFENPSFAVRDRLDLMTGNEVIPNLHVWGTWLEQQPPQIGSELLLTIAKESKPLIFVDPFRYAHGAEENDSTEMMAIMQHLRHCAAAGGAVVILHHPSKAEGSTGRGSSAIKGAADVAFLQEMADPNDGGLITLRCIKNRFGETHPITIRPDFDSGRFEITDSPLFTRRTVETEKLLAIITQAPGLTQNAWWKQSGMMKSRFVSLVKENNGTLWREEKSGNSLKYAPIVLRTQNNPENNRTGQAVADCSSVLSPLGENREQAARDPGNCSKNSCSGNGDAGRISPFTGQPMPARFSKYRWEEQ